MPRHCIVSQRATTALVCLWCEGPARGYQVAEDLEREGYSVRSGVCESCAVRFHADSLLRDPNWALGPRQRMNTQLDLLLT